jgi:hypothetical protein
VHNEAAITTTSWFFNNTITINVSGIVFIPAQSTPSNRTFGVGIYSDAWPVNGTVVENSTFTMQRVG